MATLKSSLSHLERTEGEPRDPALHTVTIDCIDAVSESIRLFQLRPKDGEAIKYLPGQWLDVYVPGVSKAGGFTITSSPPLFPHSQSLHSPHIELAIQKSPDNPPAAWLWQEQKSILGRELNVRVGGSFVWPPELHLRGGLRRVVFVAGGVGINPLMSMLSSIAETKAMAGSLELGFEVILLYTTRLPPSVSQILFLSRLKKVFNDLGLNGTLKLFLTGEIEAVENLMEDSLGLGLHNTNMSFHRRRINGQDLDLALGEPETRSGTVAYVCGVPSMTDGFVEKIRVAQGMEKENILFEKWW